ncbi:hemerythrin domain-containing protein [Microbacterium terricola]|uniref:Hemerythrin-like domain-containing protein n=1 Tax=Microbacterium terricola TaxID=344163 RepID=A0ABM8DYF1_9MICO|nr:hemerythrin domain-containing protein [Microbacterium terricola]UYK38697.1 hemerythrin domain-containing protein [Microbacterium terricola]BDV30615.1 hypothetical protein Microterr_12750 [Microbacterium terricola]
MATALPASGAEPPDGAGCQPDDLILVHNAFRRLYALLPDGVRGTPAHDRARVAAVERNVALVNAALHHHHRFEDEFFWDTLSTRRPACAIHVDLMKEHHAQVAALLDATPPLGAAWREQPVGATAESLASHLAAIGALLRVHLAAEEELIVPVIEQSFSQAEWDALGTEAQKAYDRSQIFLFFGLIQDSMTEEDAAELLSEVPAVIRLLYRLYGRRQYEKKLDLLSAGTARPGRYDSGVLGDAP